MKKYSLVVISVERPMEKEVVDPNVALNGPVPLSNSSAGNLLKGQAWDEHVKGNHVTFFIPRGDASRKRFEALYWAGRGIVAL